jgi:hypothetical protein
MKVRSNEGIRTTIQFGIHFKLGISFANETKLLQELIWIYTNFGDDWHDVVKVISTGAIKDAVKDFEAFDFFQKREAIGDIIEKRVRDNAARFKISIINV